VRWRTQFSERERHSPEEVITSISDVIICCTEDFTSLVEVVIRAEEDGAEDVHV
jgi:hypothetical protein